MTPTSLVSDSMANVVGGPIRWKLHIPAPPEKVFEALDTDSGRASFWAESAIEKDGQILFTFINGMSYVSRILERDPPSRYAIEYFRAIVTFDLSADGQGGTDLTLTHDGVEEAEWHEVHAGWLNVLFPLKATVGFGIDLRGHDASRLWDDGYVDQ